MTAQQGSVAFGGDAVLWASGWNHVQSTVRLHPELRLSLGFGVMGAEPSSTAAVFRARPLDFESATFISVGLRAYPQIREGQLIQGFVGLELAVENYTQSFATLGDIEVPGDVQWMRRDIRLVAGAEWRFHPAYSVSGHVAVGHSQTDGGLGFGPGLNRSHHAQPAWPRMLGVEFLRWF